MKRTFLSAATLALATTTCLADYVVEGIVVSGTNIATAADIDGRFRLKVPDNARELSFDYVGYDPVTLRAQAKMGEVIMQAIETMLQDVVVTQSIARTRQTPVAISNISGP